MIVLKIQDNSFILLVFLAKNSLNSTAAFMYSRNANTICKKCSTILAVIMSFMAAGKVVRKFVGVDDVIQLLKEIDQHYFKDNHHLQQIHDKMKYCLQRWTNHRSRLIAIKIPGSFRGNSIRCLNRRQLTLKVYTLLIHLQIGR